MTQYLSPLVTGKMCSGAWKDTLPSVREAFDRAERPLSGTITVMTPLEVTASQRWINTDVAELLPDVVKQRPHLEEFMSNILFMDYVGIEPELKTTDYSVGKAWQAMISGMSTLDMRLNHPLMLISRPGFTVWGGGLYEDGFGIGFSGGPEDIDHRIDETFFSQMESRARVIARAMVTDAKAYGMSPFVPFHTV